jgi:predicted nucleic acid-binding protein
MNRVFADSFYFFALLNPQWSLPDCISFVVMRERKLSRTLNGDHHFEQAGFEALLQQLQ